MNRIYKELKISSSKESLAKVEKFIDEICDKYYIANSYYGNISVAIMEAVKNAIIHGNKSDPSKFVGVFISFENSDLIIKISDEGLGFKPEKVPDPTIPENIESINGRGVFLMSHLADKLKYNRKGNSVTMIFKNILP